MKPLEKVTVRARKKGRSYPGSPARLLLDPGRYELRLAPPAGEADAVSFAVR